MVRLPKARTVARRATSFEERVNHEDFSERDDVQWMKHVLTNGSQIAPDEGAGFGEQPGRTAAAATRTLR